MLKLFNLSTKISNLYCNFRIATYYNSFNFISSKNYKNFCIIEDKILKAGISKDETNIINNDANDLEDESLNYDFFEPKFIHHSTNDLSKFINQMKCQGCGINLQIENQEKIGYIPPKKFFDHLNKKENEKNQEEIKRELQSDPIKESKNEIPPLREFEKVYDKSTLKKIAKLKDANNIIICERCYKLKNYLNFEDLSKDKLKDDKKTDKVDNYTTLLKKINPQRLIHQIMTRISNKAHIFYVCDISDLESTINKSILNEAKRKGIGLTFIVNKYDILPTKAVEERIRIWTGETLKEITKDIEGLNYNYILVSSKNGFGFDYVTHKIKKIKEKAKEEKTPRPKIYVVGNANVGKSTFINKLIERSNKYMRENLKYKKNFNITEKSMYESSEVKESIISNDVEEEEFYSEPEDYSEENKSIKQDNKINKNNNKNDQKTKREVSSLTASPLPGTTIGITKIESMRMGIKLFDTPGIPNKNSLSFFMDNYIDIISTTINRKIIPFTASIKQGYSVWIGALARIDFMSGEDKFFAFFFSSNVTIHRTPMLNAEEFFEKHAGNLLRPSITIKLDQLKLQKHTFNLNCDMFSLLNYDILISGLGWFSISGKGFLQIDLHLPEGVKVYLRKKPIMPYEIKSRGVKKFFGKTINSNSKINRKIRNKLEMSKNNEKDKSEKSNK